MFDNNARKSTNAWIYGGFAVLIVVLLLLFKWGSQGWSNFNANPGSNSGQNQTSNIDLTDPKTIQAIREIVTSGLTPGSLFVGSDGKLLTQSFEYGQQGATGPQGPQGPQGPKGDAGTGGAGTDTSGWTRAPGLVYLTTASDNVSIGSSSPSAFKLGISGDVGPIGTNLYTLGSGDAQWKSLTTGAEGLKLFDTYTNASNYQGGTVGFDSYLVPLPGASQLTEYTSNGSVVHEELRKNATAYAAAGSTVTLNGAMSAKVQRGCRASLNGTFYVITNVTDNLTITVDSTPAASGTVEHIYCATTTVDGIKLSSDTAVGSGDLNTFTPTAISNALSGDDMSRTLVYGSALQRYAAGGWEYDGNIGFYRAVVHHSADLVNWTTSYIDSNTTYNTQVKTLIYDEVGGRYIAAGYDYSQGVDAFVVWESTDLTNWTRHVVMTNGGYWNGPQVIVYDSTNNKFIFTALAYTTQNELNVWESTDLVTWTAHNVISTNRNMNITSLSYVPSTGKYLVGGYLRNVANTAYEASIWESTNLTSWTQHVVEANPGNQRVTSMAYDTVNGKYLAMGWDVGNNTVVWESTDLNTWTKHQVANSQSWSAVVYFDALTSTYIVGGQSFNPGNSYWEASIWYSTDLVNWTTTFVGPTTVYGRVHGIYLSPVDGRFILSGYCEFVTNGDQESCVWYTAPGTIYNYPSGNTYSTVSSSSINVTDWLDITGASVTATLNGQEQYYAFSFDSKNTWKIFDSSEASWRSIARVNLGVWQYNSSGSYATETWINAPTNDRENALSNAFAVVTNQMSETEIEAFDSTDWSATGGFSTAVTSLDVAVGQKTNQTNKTPVFKSITFYYSDSVGGSVLSMSSTAAGTGIVRPIQFKVGTNDKALFIDTDGAVGVGTNNPTGVFDVNGKLVVLGNGKVGIGTSAPIYDLDLVGGLHATGASVFDGSVDIAGVLNPTSPLTIGSEVTVNSGLTVLGTLNAASPLTIGSNVTMQQGAEIIGTLNASNPLNIGSLVTANAGLTVSGILNDGANLTIGGDTTINGLTQVSEHNFYVNSHIVTELNRYTSGLFGPKYVALGSLNSNYDSYPDMVVSDNGGFNAKIYTGSATGAFTDSGISFSYAQQPGEVRIGNFNGDSYNDIVIAAGGNSFVYVYINNAMTFSGPVSYALNGTTNGIEIGDINADTFLDIITASDVNGVNVLYGNGDGTFDAAYNVSLGAQTNSIALADVDYDGDVDVLATSQNFNSVYILKNCGVNCFTTTSFGTNAYPSRVTTGDFNEDNKVDLVVSSLNSWTVTTHLNNGTGTFSNGSTLFAGRASYVSVLDFNEDNLDDVVVSADNGSSSAFGFYTGDGDGSFTYAKSYTSNQGYFGSAVGNIDGDSAPEVAVANTTSTPGVTVFDSSFTYLINAVASTGFVGIGTTTPGYALDVKGQVNASAGICISGSCKTAWDVAPYVVQGNTTYFNTQLGFTNNALKLTGTGDVLGANRIAGGEMLLTGSGSYGAATTYSTGSSPLAVASTDMNKDGYSDIVVARQSPANVSVFLNNGAGQYPSRVDYAMAGTPVSVRVGDFNTDGYPDVAVSHLSSGFSIYLNNGAGALGTRVDYFVSGSIYDLAISDYNGDGKQDIAISSFNSQITIYTGTGTGSFNYFTLINPSSTQPVSIAAGDLTNDGTTDLIATNYNSQSLTIMANNGTGTFTLSTTLGGVCATFAYKWVTIGDMNNDGKNDIAVACGSTSSAQILISTGGNTYAAPVSYTTSGTGPLVLADVTSDGYLDIVSSSGSNVAILKNNGNGTFAAKTDYSNGTSQANGVAVGDANKDSKLDVFTTGGSAPPVVSVIMNQPTNLFYVQSNTGFVGIGTVTPGVNLDVAGAFRVTSNITANNTAVVTGTLANAPVSGTCTGQLNSLTQAVFQSTATITTSQIFYNSTRARHSRISSVTTCTDAGAVQYRVLVLQDSITGNASGDAQTVYNPLSDIGSASSGFFKNVYAVSFNGLTSTLSGGFDVAEQYQTKDTSIESGDVVSIDIGDGNTLIRETFVAKSSTASDTKVIGVISTNPGLTLGGEREGTWVKVALSGRVPVKVSTVNGSIRAGDFLTSSATAGVAARAITPGMTVGRALQDFVCPEGEALCQGTVEMFVNTTWYSPSTYNAAVTPTPLPIEPTVTPEQALSGYAVIKAGDTSIMVTYEKLLSNAPVLSVSSKKSTIAFEVLSESATGFTIKIAEPLQEDLQFTWIAMPSGNAKTSYSSY